MRKLELIVDDNGKIEVAFNTDYGGFGVSREAIDRMIELGSEEAKLCLADHIEWGYHRSYDPTAQYGMARFDPILIRVIKELGSQASGESANLAIGKVDLNDLISIHEHDGKEVIKCCYHYESYGKYVKKERSNLSRP